MAAYEGWRLGIAFASLPDDPAPVYDDVTSLVQGTVTTESGQTSETQGDTGSLAAALENADQRFTPGNRVGVHYPNVKSARRVELVDAIGELDVPLFAGWLEFPEIPSWAKSSTDAPLSQPLTITAVDRLAHLGRQRFLSTLGAHILYAGRDTLAGFWPLTELRRYTSYRYGGVNPLSVDHSRDTASTATSAAVITDGGGDPVIADDVNTLRLEPNINNSLVADSAYLTGEIQAVVGATVAAQFWVYFEDVSTSDVSWSWGGPNGSMAYFRQAGDWCLSFDAGVTSYNTTSAPALPTYKWCLVTLKVTLPSGFCELWIDDDTPATGTLSGGAIPSSINLDEVQTLGSGMQGNLAYLQLHAGDYTYTQHLAQVEMGRTGLEGQTTGARIRTLFAYAGLADSELTRIDPGVAVLQRAALAGASPTDAMAVAVETEQGDLWVAGDGTPVFADRIRRYNV